METNNNTWLTRESAYFARMAPKWEYVRRLSDGSYLDNDYVSRYLKRRGQGESKGMYDDRKANLSPEKHFKDILARWSGQFTNSESKLEITWFDPERRSSGLGDPADPQSRAWQLLNDTDGTGRTFEQWCLHLLRSIQLYESDLRILVTHPPRDAEHGPIYWKIITPEMVPEEIITGGRPSSVKIKHEYQVRASLKEKPETVHEVDLYGLGGMERWRWTEKDGEGNAVMTDEGFDYELYASSNAAVRRLPLVNVKMFDSYVAYEMARDAVSLMNKASELNNRLRVAFTPFTVYKRQGGYNSNDNPLADQKEKGSNFFTIGKEEDLYTEDAPVGGVETALAILTAERRAFYVTTQQNYEDQAKEATATEIRSQERGGRVALLQLTGIAFDGAIQDLLFLSEQIEHPGAPGEWGVATAKRTGKFKPDETESEAERDKEAIFPDGVPLTEAFFTSSLRRQYEARGYQIEDEEAFEEEAAEKYKEYRVNALLKTGLYDVVSAVQIVESGSIREMTRTDFVLNGGGQ